ncbi:MAG TPA: glycosyltransferase family 2 protein [Acidimicrobiia bacterium]|nr:glycosyltransferase family 2 protein [Acidimicrobiia bacterium]
MTADATRATPAPDTPPRVTAIVLAYGSEPLLEDAVRALVDSEGVTVDVVVVDNGCTDGGVDKVAALPGVRVERPDRNLGFAEGCNRGAALATGDLLAFVNSDAVADHQALAALARVAQRPEVGIASASLRLTEDPALLNSAGNEVHYLGFCWCGGLRHPATEYAEERLVAAATGAAMMLRRDVWRELGGFVPEYFAYHEDTDLSLRCWQQGLEVVYVPDAVVAHRYASGRPAAKLYLLERNRLITVFTTFQASTLVLLTPVLVAVELGVLGLAVRERWATKKLAGWWWLLRHLRWLRGRRRQVQAARARPDAYVAARLASRLPSEAVPIPPAAQAVDRVFAAYWRSVVRRAMRTNSL